MKPRTKNEIQVVEASSRLPELTEKQMEYAKEHCFFKYAFSTKKVCTCMECGGQWAAMENIHTEICPYCGAKLKVLFTRKRKDSLRNCFQLIDRVGDIQFIRTFELIKKIELGKSEETRIFEIIRVAYNSMGTRYVIARPRVMNFSGDFCLEKPMTLKTGGYYPYGDPYGFSTNVVYPRFNLTETVRRNGYSRKCERKLGTSSVISRLLKNPQYETLVKAGRYDILKELSEGQISDNWYQIKMMVRTDYKPRDLSLWKDMIEMAQELGKDVKSPKYVVPEDMDKMHDYLSRKITEKKEREEAEQAKKENEEYRSSYGALLYVSINDEGFEIAPLQDKHEFVEEGREMKHCVASYFNNGKSLVVSVKRNGKRVATAELKLGSFSILQCRGKCNAAPKQQKTIEKVLKTNTKLFKDALRMNKKRKCEKKVCA